MPRWRSLRTWRISKATRPCFLGGTSSWRSKWRIRSSSAASRIAEVDGGILRLNNPLSWTQNEGDSWLMAGGALRSRSFRPFLRHSHLTFVQSTSSGCQPRPGWAAVTGLSTTASLQNPILIHPASRTPGARGTARETSRFVRLLRRNLWISSRRVSFECGGFARQGSRFLNGQAGTIGAHFTADSPLHNRLPRHR